MMVDHAAKLRNVALLFNLQSISVTSTKHLFDSLNKHDRLKRDTFLLAGVVSHVMIFGNFQILERN